MKTCCKTAIRLLVLFTLCCSSALAAPEKIVFKAVDGYKITGHLTNVNSKAGVVLLHMYGQSKESWNPLVDHLTAQGITSLAIDMRGHGESRIDQKGNDDSSRVQARDTKLFKQMYLDVEASVRFLVDNGVVPEQIGIIGASVGCSVAIQTVSENKVSVAAIVVMTPGKKYLGVPTLDHIKKWHDTPLLILTSKEEEGRGAKVIYNKLKNRGATLRVFDLEDIHGTNMFGEIDHVEKLISVWLADILL